MRTSFAITDDVYPVDTTQPLVVYFIPFEMYPITSEMVRVREYIEKSDYVYTYERDNSDTRCCIYELNIIQDICMKCRGFATFDEVYINAILSAFYSLHVY